MKAHVLDENNIVINTIIVDSLDFMPNLILAGDTGGIGWIYENGFLKDPNITDQSDELKVSIA